MNIQPKGKDVYKQNSSLVRKTPAQENHPIHFSRFSLLFLNDKSKDAMYHRSASKEATGHTKCTHTATNKYRKAILGEQSEPASG